jgi:predicted DsbA family dithiol-disulfide isomerase
MVEHEETLREYADYVCPFCYLTHHSLEQYQQTREDDLTIDWHPYDLRSQIRGSDTEIDDGKEMEYPSRVKQRINQLKTEYNADEMLDLGTVPKVDSLNAQLVSIYVMNEYPEQWTTLNAAIFDALWQEGRDISDTDELTKIAANVGVDSDDIQAVTRDDELRSHLFELFAKARVNGVTDIPTFVFEDQIATGFLSPDELEQFVQKKKL